MRVQVSDPRTFSCVEAEVCAGRGFARSPRFGPGLGHPETRRGDPITTPGELAAAHGGISARRGKHACFTSGTPFY